MSTLQCQVYMRLRARSFISFYVWLIQLEGVLAFGKFLNGLNQVFILKKFFFFVKRGSTA